MGKMRSGQHSSGLFCPMVFHDQIQKGEIFVEATDHPHVVEVTHKDNFVEYAFWDEAGLACPGGETYEEAVKNFNFYCEFVLGA